VVNTTRIIKGYKCKNIVKMQNRDNQTLDESKTSIVDSLVNFYYNLLYKLGYFPNLRTIKVDKVRKRYDGKGVKIAVINSGCDIEHPEIRERFEAGNPGKNYVGIYPCSSLSKYEPNNLDDTYNHGTALCSLIAGKKCGIARASTLYCLKVFDQFGRLSKKALEKALIDCDEKYDVDIINLSLSISDEPRINEVCDVLASKNKILVAAAGNMKKNNGIYYPRRVYPANYPSVLSVGSINNNYLHSEILSIQ
jgi:major intracellular serine protease